MAGHYGVVLFYRGSWCPYCNAQLSAFQRSLDSLTAMDIQVAALSVDDEATTQDLIGRHDLRFPVGHSADGDAIAEATGAFVNRAPRYLQSTGFVLDPAGRVVVSVYSSGAIGRLVPQDVLGAGPLPPRACPGRGWFLEPRSPRPWGGGVSRGTTSQAGRPRRLHSPGSGLPEEPVAVGDPAALACRVVLLSPSRVPDLRLLFLPCAWARWTSTRRRVKTASLTCRFRAHGLPCAFPSASFLS
jgi:peroxiredoxin